MKTLQKALFASCALFAASCWFGPSAPRTPEARLPLFDAMPGRATSGNGRIILDVVGARCRVELARERKTETGTRVVSASLEAPRDEVLCVTPCEIELPLGVHQLTFCGRGPLPVTVSPRRSAFRAALSNWRGYSRFVQWEPAQRSPSGELSKQ